MVNVDLLDVGGMAEVKWIAGFGDLHGIQIAPRSTAGGLIGIAALIRVSATLPVSYIAFELKDGNPE